MSKLPWNYLQIDQQSPEWLHARCGCVTASRVKDVVSKLKSGKPSAARQTYMLELLAETISGRAAEHYVSAPMMYGIENEPLARNLYECERGVDIERVGFVLHPKIKRAGASPDGLIGDDGLLEIKVPNTTTHLTYFMDGVMPEEYIPQVQWQLACTGRKWADFMSYDPRMPMDFGIFIVRVDRDEKLIEEMECDVTKFRSELDAMAAKLLKNRPAQTAETTAAPGPPKAILPDWKPVRDSEVSVGRGSGG